MTESQTTLDYLVEAASAKCFGGGLVSHVSRDSLLKAISEIRRLRQLVALGPKAGSVRASATADRVVPSDPAKGRDTLNYLEVIVDALEWWGCADALGAAGRVVDRLKEDGFVIVNEVSAT